jgi:flavin reductase (DIM6/NTAB) family NADH-FMN oxidoreductase RutF
MREISGEAFVKENAVTILSQEYLVLTARAEGVTNCMTISWGEFGYLWNLPVFTVFVRKERFTKHLLDGSKTCSLSRLNETGHQYSAYFGTVSGRDHDKIKESGLHLIDTDEAPYFENSNLVILGTKIYTGKLSKLGFQEKHVLKSCYTGNSLHYVYVYRIDKVLVPDKMVISAHTM